MKSLKYLMMAVTAAMLFACSDDSSSDTGSNAHGANSGEAMELTGKVSINEDKQTIQYYTQRTLEGCFQKGLDFNWKTVALKVDTIKFKYEFVDDTLVLHSGTKFSKSGFMFVGGKGGESLEGTWKSTLCSYNHDTGEGSCKKACSEVREKQLKKLGKKSVNDLDDDEREELEAAVKESKCLNDKTIEDVTLKISGSDIKVTTQIREVDDYDFNDYMNSYYISSLYTSIKNGSCSLPSVIGIMSADSLGVQKARRVSEIIKEKSKSKNSLTFEVDGDYPITVKVDKASYDEEKVKISMTVDMGELSAKVCELQYEAGDVGSGDCNSDNSDLFKTPSSVVDDEGTKYKYVSTMEESNVEKFNECIFKGLKKLADATHGKKATCPDKYEDLSKYSDLVDSYSDYYSSYYDYYGDDEDIEYDYDYDYDYDESYLDDYIESLLKAGNKELSAKAYLKIRNAQIRALKELSK